MKITYINPEKLLNFLQKLKSCIKIALGLWPNKNVKEIGHISQDFVNVDYSKVQLY
ncbi:MAG: hypothetical protein F6K34_13615 [Okeania sp. SIO4D6]|uniref:hypothetical protein n=1 Tax=Okeania sp. SIO2G5 TaxID=2607796 RepID=UPI0013C86423|nr:hypothetical protein [Okeania sp. SIO2G5]NEP05766.1 hypothetical protein [Okeania sp. SIO4D6]NEP38728.1 hypothetical protein [Okeania sp. SIO2H7]